MKTILLLLLLSFVGIKIFAQKQVSNNAPQKPIQAESAVPLIFKETKHDFGKIKKGVPVTYEFSFNNTSGQAIVIESAKAQCGCTTPIFPKGLIEKGATDKITVTYNAANPGTFMKQVTVTLAKFKEPVYLVVSGEVLPSAPQKENQ